MQTKPACAGSSIGVSIAYGLRDTLTKCQRIISDGIDSRVVVELFASGGREFTAIVLDVPTPQNEETETLHRSRSAQAVALLPTEVELIPEEETNGSLAGGAIFNYRRKYLPTRQVGYYTPPRFPPATVTAIREGAAKLFRVLGLRDFARVDGWLLPAEGSGRDPDGNGPESYASGRSTDGNGPEPDGSERNADGNGPETGASGRSPDRNGPEMEASGRNSDGTIVFSDINLMSGMEQTSFLFQQAAEVGLSHADVLRRVLDTACARNRVGRSEMGGDNNKQRTSVSRYCVLSHICRRSSQPTHTLLRCQIVDTARGGHVWRAERVSGRRGGIGNVLGMTDDGQKAKRGDSGNVDVSFKTSRRHAPYVAIVPLGQKRLGSLSALLLSATWSTP